MSDLQDDSQDDSQDDLLSDLRLGIYHADLYDERGGAYQDSLAEEEPLTLTMQGEPYAVFMRTPGDDRALIYGFLYTERVIEALDDVEALNHCVTRPGMRMRLRLASGVSAPKQARRDFISSSCGLCSLRDLDDDTLSAHMLSMLPGWSPKMFESAELLKLYQEFDQLPSLFSVTGGAHVAALINPQGELRHQRSDVGRHNAVDKVIGAALLSGELSLRGWSLWVSSRAGFEIVSKAIAAEVSALVTLGAASGAAHRLAVASGLPLYSFTRGAKTHRHSAP